MIDLSNYIQLTEMMVISTISENGFPYTANVYFKSTKDNKFYFTSKKHREHSKHIENNNNVAWSIINTELFIKTDKDKKGLQFQWTAKIVQWKEAEKIQLELFDKKISYFEMLKSWQFLYECTPYRIKIWDEEIYFWNGKIIEL